VSALRERLADMVRINGPMPVSLYMLTCLHDPKDGYYATRAGFNTDFTTAPETSQVFGELLGLWAAHEWIAMGSPLSFRFIELGPGRGTMMADMMRAAESVTGFREAAEISLVEASPALREHQAELLSAYRIQHFEDLEHVPKGPTVLVANEFLDCLPVRQFVRDGNGWRERQVGFDVFKELDFGIGPPADLPPHVIPASDEVEFAVALETVVDVVARRFASHSGRALFIDYGPDDHSPGDTLRAYKAGKQVSPMAAPGTSDLTADVDFPRLAHLAEAHQLAVHGPIRQGYFLRRLGARERAMQLAGANPARSDEISAALRKLTALDEMGSRFKAICLSPKGAEAPPGF
jgi:NADH dehydrogenase [ubiquinone] 1 alpha subcomplex assembly factor 7